MFINYFKLFTRNIYVNQLSNKHLYISRKIIYKSLFSNQMYRAVSLSAFCLIDKRNILHHHIIAIISSYFFIYTGTKRKRIYSYK